MAPSATNDVKMGMRLQPFFFDAVMTNNNVVIECIIWKFVEKG